MALNVLRCNHLTPLGLKRLIKYASNLVVYLEGRLRHFVSLVSYKIGRYCRSTNIIR